MDREEKSAKAEMGSSIFWAIPFVAAACFAIALAFYFWTFWGELLAEHEKWGQFGDYMGGVLNPLFGLMGLVLLLATYRLQGVELQRSTEELAKSADALRHQHDALTQQNFENTFFQLLHRFSELVSEFQFANQVGLQALLLLYRSELRDVSYHKLDPAIRGDERAITAYMNFYANHRHELGHYFRTLYHIFSFVDKSSLSDEKKVAYCNIARAQLSTQELGLLFYNGIWGEGKAGFRPLIEKYGILKHVNAVDLLDPSHRDNLNFYARDAFLGSQERKTLRDQKVITSSLLQ